MRPTTFKLEWNPGATYKFMPVSCLHWPIGEKSLLRQWIKEVKEDPFAFSILLGDSTDAVRTHYRKHLKAYLEDGNSQEALDDFMRGCVRDLARELLPIRDRLIGGILGNHHWVFLNGVNSEQLLCQELGIPYLGVSNAGRLEFRDKNRVQRYALTYVAHHSGGCRGSRTASADLAALKRMETGWDVDIYTAGHTHRMLSLKEPKLTIPTRGVPHPLDKPKAYIRAGAFLKGFGVDHPTVNTPHRPHYAEEAFYPPSSLGWVTLKISFHQKEARTWRHEFRVEY